MLNRIPLTIALLAWLAATLGGCSLFEEKTEVEQARDIYRAARAAMLVEHYSSAIELYQKLETTYPFSPYAQAALLEAAYAHYKINDTETAVVMADRFITGNPNHPRVDYAYYLKGLAYFDRGKNLLNYIVPRDRTTKDARPMVESFGAFKQLHQRFPDSPYRNDAEQRLLVLRNLLAVHEIRIAHFYLRQGSYVAAVNRIKYMLEKYDGAQHTPDGLYLMAQAYRRLGSDDLAHDTLRVLKYNYPGYLGDDLRRIGEVDEQERKGWFAGLRNLGNTILEKLHFKAKY